MGSSAIPGVLRGLRLTIAVLLLPLAASAQVSVSNTFTVPAGSSSGQIAQAAEANWRIGAFFECKLKGSQLKVIGRDTTSCFKQAKLIRFTPEDGSQTEAGIQFELRVTCAGPLPQPRASIGLAVNLDGQGFVALSPGANLVTAASGEVLTITVSTPAKPPAMGTVALIGLTASLLGVALLRLRERRPPLGTTG